MRILIIDDDETFCHLLVEILEEMGMPAVWTTNGLTGYEMMTRDDYELCIIDVRMPLVLGTDLAEAIREDHPQVKIILASAFADETLQDYAKRNADQNTGRWDAYMPYRRRSGRSRAWAAR